MTRFMLPYAATPVAAAMMKSGRVTIARIGVRAAVRCEFGRQVGEEQQRSGDDRQHGQAQIRA